MKIGIIGAGRAGSAMALALAGAGHQVAGVADIAPERAAALAREVSAEVLDPAGVAGAAEVIVLAVPDGAVGEAALRLAQEVEGLAGRTFLHLSGALPAEALRPLARAGAIGSCHPLLAVAEPRGAALMLSGCHFAVEGEPAAVAVAEELVRSLGGKAIRLRPEDKALYHAAAVMASNYLVTLLDAALSLYESLGLERAGALEAIRPLIEGTLTNVYALGPEAALTGPISRGDAGTIAAHLADLARRGRPANGLYRAMGRATAALALRAGRIDARQARTLEEMLADSGVGF